MSKYPNQNLSLASSSLSSPPGHHPQMSGGPSNTPIASSSLSRASSTGSLYAQGGSAANTDGPTDDEDSDGRSHYSAHGSNTSNTGQSSNFSQTYRERRREAHTQAEQKRRDAIKKGYDHLLELLPTGSLGGEDGGGGSSNPASPDDLPGGSNGKVSKATILQKSIDYIVENQQKKEKQDEELAALKREVRALEIMRTNYEQLVKAHQARVPLGEADSAYNDMAGAQIPANLKFEVFRQLMDSLFESFNEKVSMRQFQELSAGVFSWLEEQCKPQLLQEMLHSILQDVRAKYQQLPNNLSDEDDTEMPYDERNIAGGNVMGEVPNSYPSMSNDHVNKRL